MPKKLKIGVIYGGPSHERPVSLVTGKAICENLDKKKYEILPIEISKDGKFFLDTQYFLLLNEDNKQTSKNNELISVEKGLEYKNEKIDVAFIALHGTYGEDGCLQGMLELNNIKYTGSNVTASATAMNKAITAQIYKANGLDIPKYLDFTKREWGKDKAKILKTIKNQVKLPCVLKPVDQGSSFGVFLCKKTVDLEKIILKTFKYSNWIMAQEFIDGTEATCGVLEKNHESFALPPTEIVANAGEFYDYKSKYADGGSTHYCPARFDKKTTNKIQEIALKAHRALGCRGMSRTDVFVTPDKKIYLIETNTIPGMTPTSLLPEAAGKIGIKFSKMLDLIIKASL